MLSKIEKKIIIDADIDMNTCHYHCHNCDDFSCYRIYLTTSLIECEGTTLYEGTS